MALRTRHSSTSTPAPVGASVAACAGTLGPHSEMPGYSREAGQVRTRQQVLIAIALTIAVGFSSQLAIAADLSEQDVRLAIEKGKKFLVREQNQNGSWSVGATGDVTVGITSLSVLALINSGMSPQDPPVRRGLKYLRELSPDDLASNSRETYQTSLLIMALVAARDRVDSVRIARYASRLEGGQITTGSSGSWTYKLERGGVFPGDPSNAQFAILGLREAADAGYMASRETWERARDYWESTQNPDGGWGYSVGPSKGSMTVAGISSLSITQQMLKSDEGVAPDGTPPCCDEVAPNKSIQRGLAWMSANFSVSRNPGSLPWFLYYIYGLERAGRLSGQRFFGDHDWYREGTSMLITIQNPVDGHWIGTGEQETHPVFGTSLGLLFLSKGLAPVLVNKLKYGPPQPRNLNLAATENWNRHPRDVRNLVELISYMPKWPKLLTSQEVDLARAVKSGGVNALVQAPVLFITGRDRLEFSAEETKLIKGYLEEGNFIFACPSCDSDAFEPSFRELVLKLMPPGEGELKLLPPEHPVYRSEHPLLPEDIPLYGVDFGCRTSIIYSPEDLACLWDYWAKVDPPNRNVQLKTKIIRATQIGVNVMAYATGREPPDKMQVREARSVNAELDNIERGLLQIAQVKHEGGWDTAPRALRNLLMALNDSVGLSASTKARNLPLSDPNIFRYPILYMHGRNRFAMPAADREQMQLYLDRGGVLVADACCGAKPFDRSFREFVEDLFPGRKLERIPITHEIFSEKIGTDIKLLKRRTIEGGENAGAGNFAVRTAEPILEGIEIDGRYAVIYSKYDISCALERQIAGSCEGYLPEDAVKLGTNIVLYCMLQDLRLKSGELGKGR